jgi:HK97 family phage portal protein
MGLLAQRFEERNDTGWLTRDDGVDGPVTGRATSAGVLVSANVALSLTTVWRCVDLLSAAVSQSPKDIILKVGGKSFPEFVKPTWLVTPDPTDPSYTISDYFAQIAVDLLLEGNFFTHVYPYVLDPQVLTVIPPSRVVVRPGPLYDVKDETGRTISTLGPMEMLHGKWLWRSGSLRGMSPLEALRRGIGSAVAAEDFGARFFGQGATLSFGVEVPGQLDKVQKTELAESLRKKHVGNQNSHAIGVLTGGAKFVPNLAPSPEQAQMLATRKFSVEDLCRPYGVPPNMAGSQEPGASSYASADVWRDEFRDYAVLPLALRIEAHHNRLVSVPSHIADPNAAAEFKFNLDHVARTSLLTRYQAHAAGVQGGFLTPHEARANEDLPPVDPNATDPGDMLYMQRQMVPLKDLATAAPIPGAPVDANLNNPPVPPGSGEGEPKAAPAPSFPPAGKAA